MRLALVGCAIIFSCILASPLLAQLDRAVAQRLGLETAWKSQVQVPLVGTGIVSTHLWAEPQNPRRFAVVELPDQTIRVSADTLDKDGKAIGVEGAKTLARQQAAKLLGRNDGFQVVEVSIPRLKLVVITCDGLVQALDAETGELIWTQACGQSHAPAFPGAVSPVGVALIQGEHLYVLDWNTGKVLMTKRLKFSSSNAIAVCNDIAYVSDFTGRVQAYGLTDRFKQGWSYVMQGRAVGPTATFADQSFCAIATDEGFAYVYAGGETPGVYIRYETNSALTGSLTAQNNAFYVGNAEGLVSKITLDDRLGTIKWELRAGSTISAQPLVVGERVYVATESGYLFSIEDESGIAEWKSQNIDAGHPIAVAGGILYCVSLTGELLAVDAQTGAVRAQTSPLNLAHPFVNQINDRVVLISKYGQVHCLRPLGAVLPTMLAPVVVPAGSEETSGAPSATAQAPAEAAPFGFEPSPTAATENPFGVPTQPAADPFGAPSGTSDPFGGENPQDPFGSGGAASNPFGSSGSGDPFSGSDPFGSGN